jgi:hypothetical protein
MDVDLPSSSGLQFFFAKGAVLMGFMLTDVSKSFGSFQAIKDLSLEVREDALFGFLGETRGLVTCLYLIRPDGSIAFRSYPADATSLNDYLKKLFL